MTGHSVRIPDELLRRSLAELAAGPGASELRNEVLRSVDGAAQVGRRPWDVPGVGRAGLLVAAALLLTAGIGAAIALSGPRPQPQPAPSVPQPQAGVISVPDFVVPFTYSLPAGETVKLGRRGVISPSEIYSREPVAATPQYGAGKKLQIFIVSPIVHACFTVSGSSTSDSIRIGTDPTAFLDGLRDTGGVGITLTGPTMLGNLPAMGAVIDPTRSRCGHYALHVNGLGLGQVYEPTLDNPGRLTVARLGTETIWTIGVLISADTEQDLADWWPIAQAYVDTFVFEATGSR